MTDRNTKLEVHAPSIQDWYDNGSRAGIHFKAAAAKAVRLTAEGTKVMGHYIEYPTLDIYHLGYPVAQINSRFGGIMDGLSTGVYGAVRYIQTAVANERRRIQAWSDEWLTPTEIEAEYDIRAGSVRQHINRNREWLLEHGYIKQADARTVLMRRAFANGQWKVLRYEQLVDTNEYASIVDLDRVGDNHYHYNCHPLRPELYPVLSESDWMKPDVFKHDGQAFIRANGMRGERAIFSAAKYLKSIGYDLGDS